MHNEDKIATTRNGSNNHKNLLIIDNENSTILRSDNTIIDHHYDDDEFECVDQSVILRPHNQRTYHYSITSTTSNDMQFSDEDNETLDVLYPLPAHADDGMTKMNLSAPLF